MPPRIDLRRYNITDQATMIEFLELIVNKVPQMVRLMKKLQLENQSLRNHNATLKGDNDTLNNRTAPAPLTDANISVSDRLAGKTFSVPEVTEAERLAQMAAAAPPPTGDGLDELDEVTTDPALLPNPLAMPAPPSAPGEIGNLNLPAAGALNTRPPVPSAPELPPPSPDQEPAAIIDDSEIVNPDPDDGLNADDIVLDETLDLSQNLTPPTPPEVTPPSTADTTPVGTRIAKTQKKAKRKKRK